MYLITGITRHGEENRKVIEWGAAVRIANEMTRDRKTYQAVEVIHFDVQTAEVFEHRGWHT